MKRFHVIVWMFATLLLGFIAGRYRNGVLERHTNGRYFSAGFEGVLMQTDIPTVTDAATDALTKPVTIDVRGIRMRQLLSEISRQVGVPVSMSENLDAWSIDEGLVALTCTSEPLNEAIKRVQFADMPQGVYAAGGQLFVTDLSDDRMLSRETRVCDVSSLIEELHDRQHRYGAPENMMFRDNFDAWQSSSQPSPRPLTKEVAEELATFVQDGVAADSWRDNGGSAGVRNYCGFFVITTTNKNHRAIATLLEGLATSGRSGDVTTRSGAIR